MARRKITEPEELPDAADLPALTGKQMRFVRGILDGKNATDAYRAAYDVANMATETIWVEASKLRNSPKVSTWIITARKACLGASKLTLEGHLQELERLKELAMGAGNYGAAVQAEQLRGKATGFYVEQVRDLTEHDPISTLNQLAQLSPELAKRLAEDHGITWQSETAH